MEKEKVVHWKIPPDLIEEFEKIKEGQGIKTNTKTIEFCIREYVKKIGVIKMTNNTKSVKKTLVTLLCATALFSVANMAGTKAEETVNPNSVETTVKPAPAPAVVPSTDSVETGKAEETPVVPVPSKPENNPVVPEIPSTETKPSETPKPEETKPSETPKPEEAKPEETKPTEEAKPEETKPTEEAKPENKQDNTHLPLVDPTLPNTKPIETNKGTVTGTDNGKVILKDSTTGQEVKVAPEVLGGKVEKDGKLTRLPNTGVETSVGLLALGFALLASGFTFMKKPRKN